MQVIRKAGGGACDVANCHLCVIDGLQLQFQVASFPVPRQLFVACPTASDIYVRQATKSWAWDWERGYTVWRESLPPADPCKSVVAM